MVKFTGIHCTVHADLQLWFTLYINMALFVLQEDESVESHELEMSELMTGLIKLEIFGIVRLFPDKCLNLLK